MKTNNASNTGPLPRTFFRSLLASTAAVALWTMPGTARGQIYVTEENIGTIGVYSETGATINPLLISGLIMPTAIAISGNDLFIANYVAGTIGKYTTSGATVNASLISGLSGAVGIAVSGTDLFVVSGGVVRKFTSSGAAVNPDFIPAVYNPFAIAVSCNSLFVTSYGTDNHDGTVGVYDATTGAAVNASLVSGLDRPFGIAVSGEDLFVTSFGGTIGKYTTSGATVNATLVSGLNGPVGIAVSGGNLFVANNGDGFAQNGTTIGEYDAITGATVNAALVSGLAGPWGLVVADTTPPVIACPAEIAVPCSVDPLVSVAFSVSATDDFDPCPAVACTPPSDSGFPIGTTTVNCTATDASGNHSFCAFTVTRGPLAFAGFLAPIGGADGSGGSFASPVRTFKMASTIPVKFTASCGGSAVLTGAHRLQAIKYSGLTSVGTPIDATPQDAATTGDQFRLVDSQWQFNLDTKATGMSTGIWQLTATLSDGSQHRVWIQLK